MSTAEHLGAESGVPLDGSRRSADTAEPTSTPFTPAPAPAAAPRRARRFGTATLLVAGDVVAFVASVLLAGELRPTTVITAGLAVALLAFGGLYRHQLTLSVLDDLPAITGRLLVAGALAATYREIGGRRPVAFGPRLWLVVVTIGLVLAMRALTYGIVRWARRTHRSSYRTLVVGAGRIGHEVAGLLVEHPELGLEPIGFYDPDPLPSAARTLTVFDGRHDLADIITRLHTPVVIVAFSGAREEMIVDALRTCDRLDCEIFMVPRLFELQAPPSRSVDRIWSLKVIRLGRASHRSPAWPVKRLVDVAVASLGLLVLSPLLALVALAVWFDGHGRHGVLFRQERVGVDHRRFTMYKFRTLGPVDADESSTRWNIDGDHRVRRLGRVLRATSLDELPQLWNVLRGDMSLVGPRPERPHFVGVFSEEYPGYPARHRVPSGLTGWAQVHGLRGDTSIGERARFDNDYIEHWSLWNDVKIILRTATATVFRRGR